MLERYTRPEMANIWSLHNQYQSWLEVEIAVDEAWAKLGEIDHFVQSTTVECSTSSLIQQLIDTKLR